MEFSIILSQNIKNIEGEALRRKQIRKKSLTRPKKMKAGAISFAGKKGKPFWFTFLCQILQFVTIKYCRTSRNFFVSSCGLKKRVTIIVAFNFKKRRLKMTKFNQQMNVSSILRSFIRIRLRSSETSVVTVIVIVLSLQLKPSTL